MRIRQIDIFKAPFRLKNPFVISLESFSAAMNIFLLIRSNEGLTGSGECSPFMSIHGESMDSCFIIAQKLAKVLLGKSSNPSECAEWMDKAVYGNSSIKSAFDMAIHDLVSQEAGIPLYQLLGGKEKRTLITDYTVSLGKVEEMVAAAIEIKENGFQFIKVKLGGDASEDILRIQKIRESIGDFIPLRIDANQGWKVESAIEILNALESSGIQHCEEPLPRWDYMNLRKIKESTSIPIMADESCWDHHDAERLIELKACHLFNLKLGKSSGFGQALKIIRLAEKENMKMQAGGFLESRLGFTAAAHLALASPLIQFIDFDTPLMHAEDPVMEGITYGYGGQIEVPSLPGLGASIDPEFLKGLEKISIH